ncbi:PA2169 family four-helix-bundle protein [Luteimonas sp BLCC-B24]|uniref:PA2169 family four-helix-bundle protein n=1 Tax=Luteimonas sp. BLCC-B24 TaxID=3025317 RepID=UPI00234CAB81|nr:PA2169 family four-helix-bundle protein [Luteimonas sp. BLCC-B24]MDC7805368.1 PA2169 family four-helix-bundle protein [Luteimonas sp. BLCC-B24]
MSNKTANTLNDLISIARDGKEFYEEAAQKVDDAELKTLFARIATSKAQIVNELSTAVQAAGGKPEDSGTMVGSMQQMYGKIRAALGDTEYGYVAELEESEDRLLEAFDEAARDADTPPAARDVVVRLLPEVRSCHDVMRARKHAMKAAK